ncbi:hypothetical protein OPV22_031503 [Ensete ventricosum]|uniref:MMS19 nucleotide excision repair protein n=1 Tax=Ensete ventricosum TaxID=4639 RepID=A0AAV8PTR9_ENSVE|nr:hypothetical protein OPV22_031503 [Ensete ventricosum]
MEKPNSWIAHVEAFVDSARASNQQAASVDAIVVLVHKDLLTLEGLVREMEQYLTTSDHVIRARGILLLAEVLSHLLEKPLDSRTVSSLVEFFTSKLEDWQVLRGALIGCLALLKRTKKIGMVESNDAKSLAESFLRNVQVQSLAVHDRKLCFEVIQRLLDGYTQTIVELGDDLVYGICEAIDEEKDPRCLMLTFSLVGTLGRLFPDPSGPMGNFSSDVFDILSRYFPIYFTHPKGDGLDITRDDLSKALMDAFSSSSLFAPFVIPLLLEKLSSSLPSAKLDSLKYLNSCLRHYGADKVVKHAQVIWSNLKDVIFNLSPHRSSLSTYGSDADMDSEVNQIANEALNCLQTAISHLNFPDQDSFLCLIIDDEDIGTRFWSITSIKNYSGTSTVIQCQLSALGSILSIASKVSVDCCTKVFQKFFSCLMDILGVSGKHPSKLCVTDHNTWSDGLNFGALYLSMELLTSCRELTLSSKEFAPEFISEPRSCFYVLKNISRELCNALGSILETPDSAEHVYCAVKGLQVLATFPEIYSPVSEATYEDILVMLMSIITRRSKETYLWELSLKALVQIGLWIENDHDSAKAISYNKLVIQRIVSMLQPNDSTISLSLKLVAISEISSIGIYLLRIVQAFEEAIVSNLRACFLCSSATPTKCFQEALGIGTYGVLNLQAYDGKNTIFIRWHATVRVGDQHSLHPGVGLVLKSRGVDVLDQVMTTLKHLVVGCTEESQFLILQKAYSSLPKTLFVVESLPCALSQLEGLQCIQDTTLMSCRDEWIFSLFGSVVIALRPQTPLVNVKILVNLFVVLLLKGNTPAAQALASMVNKWPADVNKSEISYSLDQAIEEILKSCLWTSESSSNFINRDSCFQKYVVLGLAWIGKGLLMRGHEKVKEITMLLLKCLVAGKNVDITPFQQHENGMKTVVIATLSSGLLTKNAVLNVNVVVVLYRAFGHVISDTPLAAVVGEAKKIVPTLADALAMLSLDIMNKDLIYSLLLVVSGILMDDKGKAIVLENVHTIISLLIKLISYPHLMIVRETAIQGLVAISALPYARIYPYRPQVLRAVSTALDDRKRVVRQEAVRCRQAWFGWIPDS